MKKILISSVIISTMIWNAFAADFSDITVLNNGNIEISTTPDLNLAKWEVSWDLKVLKDYEVSFAYKDVQDSKKVFLNLKQDLDKNKEYTILWIDWAEANMTFIASEKIIWEYLNSEEKEGLKIEKINIVDLKTIEVYYSEELNSEEFVYKLLTEIETKSKISSWENTFNISFKNPLETEKKYIILSNYINDENGKKVKMDDYIYDFKTDEELEDVFGNLPELNVASEKKEDKWNLEEMAEKAKKTPTTWAETWLIFAIAIIMTWLFSISRKKA